MVESFEQRKKYRVNDFQMTTIRSTSGVPKAIWAVVLIFGLWVSWGPNAPLALFSITILMIGIHLLWRHGESQILLYIFTYQWLQASVKVFQGNFFGLVLNDLSEFNADFEMATLLSLIGLLMLAVGMRLGSGRWRAAPGDMARVLALSNAPEKWFRYYLVAFVVAAASTSLASALPILSQPLRVIASLKWAFFFMLTYAAFTRPEGEKKLWLLAFCVEFMLGFGAFFSDFKTVIIFSLLGIVAAGARFTLKRILVVGTLVALTLALAAFWTAVKTDYRNYVSGGKPTQVVEVQYFDSLLKLVELSRNLDSETLLLATGFFLNRISYVEYFGATLLFVPNQIPHTNGELWLDAVTRPFMPRLLFPDKSLILDSARTTKYTGVIVSGFDEGSSISIGYMGESYIDFGVVGMMVIIFVFGIFLGHIYRWLVNGNRSRGLLGISLSAAILIQSALLESSITSLFGGLIVTLLVVWLFLKFVSPQYLRWMTVGPDQNGGFTPNLMIETTGPSRHHQ